MSKTKFPLEVALEEAVLDAKKFLFKKPKDLLDFGWKVSVLGFFSMPIWINLIHFGSRW